MKRKQQTMSWLQFGRRHGVSQQTISRWRTAGFVVLADDGHIDVAASDARLAARPRRYRGGRCAGPAADDLRPVETLPPLVLPDLRDTLPPLVAPVLPRFRFP
jgi:hypothetical protein